MRGKTVKTILIEIGMLLMLAGCFAPPASEEKLLAEKFDHDFYLAGKNTPAEYMVNQIAAADASRAKAILAGRLIPARQEEAVRAGEIIRQLDSEIRKGLDWPEKTPPAAAIPFTSSAPSIDGACREAAWNSALIFHDEYPLSSREKALSGTVWRVMWDESFFYVGITIRQDSPRAEPYTPAAGKGPWQADAVELFLGPGIRFRTYWEIVVAPDGSVYDALGQNNRWGSYLASPEESVRGLRTAARQTAQGYSVEIAVPWREIPGYQRGNSPRPGEEVNFTLIRCRNGVQSACHPLLYSGHNLFGHLRGTLTQARREAAHGKQRE